MWKEEQEEIARHEAYMFRKELFRTKDVHNTNVFRRYVPTKATLQGVAIHSRDGRVYQKGMYIVDSDASLHMMGVTSLTEKEKMTMRESSKIFDIQAANGVAVSVQESTSKLGAFPWVHLVEDALSVLSSGRPCNELACSYQCSAVGAPRFSGG